MTTDIRTQSANVHWPDDPIAAVTHAAPYAYYAWLAAERPLYYDDRLGLWVASSAAAVTSVMGSNVCHVRPPSEIVPKKIQGSALAEVFGHLVRMNEGERHDPLKRAISTAIAELDEARLTQIAHERSRSLLKRTAPQESRTGLTDFMRRFPVEVVARLVGVPADHAEAVGSWVRSYVVAVGPLASEAEVESGKTDTRHLVDFVRGLLDRTQELERSAFLATLAEHAGATGHNDPAPIVANGIGFMSQTYEATAGLIGSTLLALSDRSQQAQGSVGDLVRDVMKTDPPAQNTRRFLAADGIVAGQPMRQGDTVLVVLAAANLDRQNNPDTFGFGFGAHACPAGTLAVRIAELAVDALLEAGVTIAGLREDLRYLPSVAVRALLFDRGQFSA